MNGNAIVGQSGGPTSVINSSLAGVFKTAKDLGVKTVYGMRNGIQGLLAERYVKLEDYIHNDVDLELLKRTPSAFLGSCRYKLPKIEGNEATYDKLFKILDELGIKFFFYIGGNDSMDTIATLSCYAVTIGSDIKFMGVPKTIDNDLPVTDHTPGYGSAAKYVATAVKELIRDNKVNDMDIVTVIEVMGRDAGWLTGATALSAGPDCPGPDLIYMPELSFDVDKFVARVSQIMKERRSVVVAVSEGIKLEDGRYVCEYTDNAGRTTDSFGHKQLTGTARVLAEVIKIKLGCKVRAVEFSSLQRCAAHIQSETDVSEAFSVGAAAVRAASEGETGKVAIIERVAHKPYQSTMGICDVKLIANQKKDVPRDWINKAGDHVTKDFVDYVRPLILGEVSPIIVDGIPRHIDYIK
ncbi:MAG: 6-phosphofructokinase [Oscillospiraceae bacterium]